jgi:hypothetical protein
MTETAIPTTAPTLPAMLRAAHELKRLRLDIEEADHDEGEHWMGQAVPGRMWELRSDTPESWHAEHRAIEARQQAAWDANDACHAELTAMWPDCRPLIHELEHIAIAAADRAFVARHPGEYDDIPLSEWRSS